MLRIKDLTIERIIIILFSILPLVDSINGILLSTGRSSIGTIYKLFCLGVLFIFAIREQRLNTSILLTSFCIIAFIAFSICFNVFFFSGSLINTDYPIKLIFNVLTLVLLLNAAQTGLISGKSIYTILNINTWLMIAMILIPYVLGTGYTIYSGGIGYKGFFFSNNELSVALIILFYFSLYRLCMQITVERIVQLLGIAVCVILLNTKSGMAACVLGVALFVLEYLFRKGAKFKWLVVLAIALGLFVAKDFLAEQIYSFMERQKFLHRLYEGSAFTTLVSGRTYMLEDAWAEFVSGPGFPFRLLFGNGFCSTVLVEMDFIDIFFYLGLIGVLSLTVFLAYIFIKSIQNFRTDHTIVRLFAYFLIVGFSFLAGHIIFMATSGCYFILICCLNLLYTPEDRTDLTNPC